MHPLIGMSIMVALLLALSRPSKGKKDDDRDRPPGAKGGPGVSINIYQGVTPPRGGPEVVVVRKNGEEVKV
jgi:hypothetical protein